MKVWCKYDYFEAEFDYDGDWDKLVREMKACAVEHKKFMPKGFCGL